jgi:parvulin-like peptidyl-prolyl isomerase
MIERAAIRLLRRINMKRYLMLFILTVSAGVFLFAQTDLQPVATVRLTRSEPITVRQLKSELEKLAWQNLVQSLRRVPTAAEATRAAQGLGLEQRKQVLDVMINERLALQAAERDRVTLTDNELNQGINTLKAQMAQSIGRQPTDDEFATTIKNQTGLDMPAFREQIRRQALTEKYLMAKKESQIRNSIKEPTDAEILSTYNMSKAQFVRPDTIRFSMIQVAYGPDAASKNRARDLADRLSREIGSNPARFDEVALRGQAANSGYQAGDGGYLPRNLQAQQAAGSEFVEVAFNLKQGEVSKLIEGIQGYQIIKITETLAFKNLELNDIAQLGTRMTVRDYIHDSMLQQRQMEAVARATQELVTELRAGNSFQVMENNLNFNW